MAKTKGTPKALNYPFISAFKLAQDLRTFRARTETTASAEINFFAEEQRCEVVRNINWEEFNNVINQLESCLLKLKKQKYEHKNS